MLDVIRCILQYLPALVGVQLFLRPGAGWLHDSRFLWYHDAPGIYMSVLMACDCIVVWVAQSLQYGHSILAVLRLTLAETNADDVCLVSAGSQSRSM